MLYKYILATTDFLKRRIQAIMLESKVPRWVQIKAVGQCILLFKKSGAGFSVADHMESQSSLVPVLNNRNCCNLTECNNQISYYFNKKYVIYIQFFTMLKLYCSERNAETMAIFWKDSDNLEWLAGMQIIYKILYFGKKT